MPAGTRTDFTEVLFGDSLCIVGVGQLSTAMKGWVMERQSAWVALGVGLVLGVLATLGFQSIGGDSSETLAGDTDFSASRTLQAADNETSPETLEPSGEVTTTTTTSTTTTTTTTTTLPPLPVTDPSDAVLYAPIEGLPEVPFADQPTRVLNVLSEQFGVVEHYDANHAGLAIVEDADGTYLRYRSSVDNNSRTQFNVPIDAQNEAYLVYRFMLEPGFDAGDADGSEGTPVWGTGIKMPGLMRGDARDNTGGNHTPGGFSGRLMIRGTRKSDGENKSPREGITLSAYVYGQAINGQSIAEGFGNDFYFLDGFESEPFEGVTDGVVDGVGDPRIWDLPVGEWVTVVLGYRIDGGDGWFKAWTHIDGEDDDLQPRLFVDGLDWTGGNLGPDSLLFQQYWGGSGAVWYPDFTSYIRYRDFAVFDDEHSALAFAR